MDCSPPGASVHGDSPGKNTGVGCHALLQGIFLTRGLNPGLRITDGFFTVWSRWPNIIVNFYFMSLGFTRLSSIQFSSLSRVRLFVTPWTSAHQASLSITNCQGQPKAMSIQSVMPSNHVILCCPLLLLPSIPPRIRVFSSESALHIRWPKCWSFSFNISPSNEHPGLISFRMDWLDLLAVQGTLKSLLQHHSSKT